MTPGTLQALAAEAGLVIDWEDAAGDRKRVAPDALAGVLKGLGLPAGSEAEVTESRERLRLDASAPTRFVTAEAGGWIEVRLQRSTPRARLTLEDGTQSDPRVEAAPSSARIRAPEAAGYHRLELGDQEILVAVAPRRARSVEDVSEGRRIWGTAVQVYAVRDERGEAFGDFGGLARLAGTAAGHGADALAISPVHALYLADPSRYSPYSPSTRLFLNGLYADPSALFETWEADPGGGALIDWTASGGAKAVRLRRLFDAFYDADQGARRADFESFRLDGGEDLERHARFEALHARYAPSGAGGWQDWPAAMQDPDSLAVEAFSRSEAKEVAFHVFVQWLAERSLASAQAAAIGAGMAVGLIADMAVGTDAGGSHAWSRRDEILTTLNVGAPPDLFQAEGQDWGVATFSPRALVRTDFAAFRATLRAAMRLAGGLRVDHAMGLRRLWMVPHGGSAADGAYLTFPETDLLRLTALESQRAGAIVVGEDLGTVPPGFRATLGDAGVLGMSVLWFERDAQAFLPPSRWPAGSAALTSTHDLPTVAGWWSGRDLQWRGKSPAPEDGPAGALQDGGPEDPSVGDEDALRQRAEDRSALWEAFRREGAAAGPAPAPDAPGAAVDAAAAFVAAAPGPLALIPVEDLLGLPEQINLPGPPGPHPNWRRRLPLTPAALFADPAVAGRLERLNKARPR